MGMFDTVEVPCPKYSTLYCAQSKSGDCILAVYDFPSEGAKNPAPADVMIDVNRHAPFTCENCHAIFYVKLVKPPVYIPGEYLVQELQEDDMDSTY